MPPGTTPMSEQAARQLRALVQIADTPSFRTPHGADDMSAIQHAKVTTLALDGSPALDASDVTPLRKLGEGAYAQVQLCELSGAATARFGTRLAGAPTGPTGGALVAVKYLKPAMPAHEVANFYAEAALLRVLEHPNIVKAHGCYTFAGSDGAPLGALVLEYAAGGSLADAVRGRSGKYSCAQAMRWLAELARAVEYLHGAAGVTIVHRDIKPDNVLISATGRACLADFGLFRFLRPESTGGGGVGALIGKRPPASAAAPHAHSLAFTGRTGSSRFMAPESWRGEAIGELSDVFSFGVLCYEVLCARRAYDGLHLTAEQVAEYVALRGLRLRLPPEWPPQLRALVQGCWAETVRARPPMSHLAYEFEMMRQRAELGCDSLCGVLVRRSPRAAAIAKLRAKVQRVTSPRKRQAANAVAAR